MALTDDHPGILDSYREHPMRNGDVAVLTDLRVVQEVEGLADDWDPMVRTGLARILREIGATEVELAVARPDAQLLAQDHALWADLREELLGSQITVHPLIGLPAAA
jgi:ubiquinone biosynthesis protein UbiJ